jgi:hypothetical protein
MHYAWLGEVDASKPEETHFMSGKQEPRPSGKHGKHPRFGDITEGFFERGTEIEEGVRPPPEEATGTLQGRALLVARARRSLPAVIVAGVGLLALAILLIVRASS